jgi:large subunit ribosomal protein L22e
MTTNKTTATKTAAAKPATKKAAPATAKKAAAKPATEPTERVIKAGGKKGELVVAALTKDVTLTRAQLAEAASCTVGRVGEVVRWLRDNGTKDEQALIAKHLASQPKRVPPVRNAAKEESAKKASTPRKAAAKKSTAAPVPTSTPAV